MKSRVLNQICIFNNWMSKNSSTTLITIFISTIITNLCFSFGKSLHTLFIGISIYILLSILALIKYLSSKGDIKMDFSLYKIPKEGDTIVFNDSPHREFVVYSVEYKKNDVILYIQFMSDPIIKMSYMDTYKQWDEKSEIRDKKLNSILEI